MQYKPNMRIVLFFSSYCCSDSYSVSLYLLLSLLSSLILPLMLMEAEARAATHRQGAASGCTS